jgi:branched-chain amino acid transport system permease protein
VPGPSDWDDSLTTPLEGAAEASAAEGPTSPAVGRDEWVARHGERRVRREGVLGTLEQRLAAVPWWAWLTLFAGIVCLLPVGFESGYVRRVAFDTVVFMLLALALNIVVGWGGLLDLGFVAFFGIGAYTYALLSSDQYDIHLPTLVVIPLVAIVGGIVGWLVGLPSRRLTGDYLAIVTLFFFQVFLTFTNNGDNVFGESLTNGPNGILNVDEFKIFGWDISRSTSEGLFGVEYLYVALALFVLVYVALHLLNDSRTGRAWRSLREDPLAAELMGMPVNRLKLMAFAFGASVAATTGTVATSLNGSVFPQNFEFPLLITI